MKSAITFLAGGTGRKLLLAARLVLGGIFLYAAYSKLHFDGRWQFRDYHFIFAMGIDSYQMLPIWAVNWLARALPWLELALGVLLIAGAGLRWIGATVTALLLVFMTAMARAALLGLEINCGCFGSGSTSVRNELLLDSGLLLLSLLITAGAFLGRKAVPSSAVQSSAKQPA